MKIDGIDYLGIDRVLKRGSGEILENADALLFVRDLVSGAYFLACEDLPAGIALLDRYAGGCNLLMVANEALGAAAFARYGFSEKLECRQVAYYGKKPSIDPRLTIRTAIADDLPLLARNYRLISREELEAVVKRGSVLIGYEGETPVGFIGEHLEGSMGLLYVFPEHRRKGYGTALQAALIAKTMEDGFVPFGQVEIHNENSFRLQEKIGMVCSENRIVWMWK